MATRFLHSTRLNVRENSRLYRVPAKRVSLCGWRPEGRLRIERRLNTERARLREGRIGYRREWKPVYCLSEDADAGSYLYQDLADAVAKGLGGTNLYLIGMMVGSVGSGKSTVGSVLADRLKYLFMDTDAIIEQASKSSIEQIFKNDGEDAFRDIETHTLRDLHQYKNLVVGTGGGIVLRRMNWSYLQQGVVVFLNGSPEKLAPRVARDGLRGRPLLSKTNNDQSDDPVEIAREKLQRIYSERETLYKGADLEVSLEDALSENGLASVDEVVRRVLVLLNQRLESARREREAKSQYEIHGTAELPDGGSSINSPSNQDTSKGFGST